MKDALNALIREVIKYEQLLVVYVTRAEEFSRINNELR